VIDRVTALEDAVGAHVRRGQTLMVGGFGRGGVPFSILEHLSDHPDRFGDFTVIKNDASEPGLGIGLLIERAMVRRMISTHIGLNPDFIARMNRGEIDCELLPQGIFAERIRAGGAGIPAFLTDVGLGTEFADGAETVELDGRALLLQRALRGDVALVCADVVDRAGNCWWRGSNRNMCVVMATACPVVLVEALAIVEVGAIEPENVHLPAPFVTAIVAARPRRHVQPTGAGGTKESP
jgi:acetate CoA/acetoacetate CoA-transferase alpha subunit